MVPVRKMRPQTIQRQRHEWIMSFGGDVLVAAIGLATCFILKVVGEIPGGELLLIPFAPILFVIHPKRILGTKRHVRILIFTGLWLVGQVVTDIYRHTAIVDWARADASIIALGLDFICLAGLLTHSERRKAIFAVSLAIGSLLSTKISPSAALDSYPWKFGYAFGVILLGVFICCHFYEKRQYLIAGFILAALIAINLAFDYRSPVLDLMITMTLLLPVIPERVGNFQLLPKIGSIQRIWVLACFALIGGGLASYLVTHLAESGVLGYNAQMKNAEQSQNKYGILIGGRPEVLVSSRAVLDSPILGHGSWAKDVKYVDMLLDIQDKYGVGVQVDPQEKEEVLEGLIPAHSHLMTAWVWAGILGALYWAYVLGLTLKAIVRASLRPTRLTPLYVYVLVSFIWDILFSPLGATGRIDTIFYIICALDILNWELPRTTIKRHVSRLGRLPASYMQSRMRFRF